MELKNTWTLSSSQFLPEVAAFLLCSSMRHPYIFIIEPLFPGYAYSTEFLFLTTKTVLLNFPALEEQEKVSRCPDLTGQRSWLHSHPCAFYPEQLNREGRRGKGWREGASLISKLRCMNLTYIPVTSSCLNFPYLCTKDNVC